METSPEIFIPEVQSRQKLEEYFTRVSIFSEKQNLPSDQIKGFDYPVPIGYPNGWDVTLDREPVKHLTAKDSTGNQVVYCLRPEGFDGFVYIPESTYNRYLPVTHYHEKLLFGVTPTKNQDIELVPLPKNSKQYLRNYEDPLKDLPPFNQLPIINRQDINPNSAWIVTQNHRGLSFAGQAILPFDLETNSTGIHIRQPLPFEKNIVFLPPEDLITNRCGPSVAAAVLALENRYNISNIKEPLPFAPIHFTENPSLSILETTPFQPSRGGWRITEFNGQSTNLDTEKLKSFNSRMGISVETGTNYQHQDIFRVNEIGGGGSVVIPYFVHNGTLYVGIIDETRPNISNKPYISVVRGFVNPGTTHKDTIAHEISQEMEYNGDPNELSHHLQSLGTASQDPDMFGSGGVHYYALPINPDILIETNNQYIIKPEFKSANKEYNQSPEKAWEKIIGSRFIPIDQSLQSPDLFTIIATGRLLTSDLIKRPSMF